MNIQIILFVCMCASAFGGRFINVGYYSPNPAAHIPSGSVSVDGNGAVVAGPAGSIRTDNGLHSHSAGAMVDGPAGKIVTRGGHTTLVAPDDSGHHSTGYYPNGWDYNYNTIGHGW